MSQRRIKHSSRKFQDITVTGEIDTGLMTVGAIGRNIASLRQADSRDPKVKFFAVIMLDAVGKLTRPERKMVRATDVTWLETLAKDAPEELHLDPSDMEFQ
jgi:hypothetical protein